MKTVRGRTFTRGSRSRTALLKIKQEKKTNLNGEISREAGKPSNYEKKRLKAPRGLISAIYRDGLRAGYDLDEIHRSLEAGHYGCLTWFDAEGIWEHLCDVIRGGYKNA